MCAYTPIRVELTYEQIIAQIERRIVSGELKAGDRLPPERELAEQFKVSRSAVREAVRALQQKGLVVVRPSRGTFITIDISKSTADSLELIMKMSGSSQDGFSDLYECRNILEPELAALAAQRRTADDIGAMKAAIEDMDAAIDNMEAYIAADNHFHRAIARGTQNSLFASMLDPIIDLLIEQRKRNFLAGVQSPQRAQTYHRKILDAIVQGDPLAAREAMKEHLEQVIMDSM